ncbi:hypothetical protein EMIT0373P_20294 [Pseudomonas chlororaphis]
MLGRCSKLGRVLEAADLYNVVVLGPCKASRFGLSASMLCIGSETDKIRQLTRHMTSNGKEKTGWARSG